MSDNARIDKWLWAARFFKTRTLATHAVELGRVLQNELRVKPSHGVKLGDLIEVHQAEQVWQIEVLRLLEVRGSASVAQTMYQETSASAAKRAVAAENKKLYQEPGAVLARRPTKRERRQLDFTRS
ncbi:MAG: RNA-binding S4 domain-containing protein [Undibacterium sp.]|uniref:RNA-binding S4 domain-containing protein n=1 Tax=Undibacterium sp. TaxID=1914977 RepID=UPI00271E573B|nr:RNA-binding S4 domain-containing protein [Undibacterium sp.]MDO8651917.1 RNA-binding S4 domain-containing protein [Undibacterium sp.]